MRDTGKPLPARFNTLVRFINRQQFAAVVLQIMRPPPKPGRDLQNCCGGQTVADPRKNCAGPLRGRATPRLRPFLSRLSPIGTSFVEWLGAESNRRHVDFQSTALPTELPSRDGAIMWRRGIFTMQQCDCRASVAVAEFVAGGAPALHHHFCRGLRYTPGSSRSVISLCLLDFQLQSAT